MLGCTLHGLVIQQRDYNNKNVFNRLFSKTNNSNYVTVSYKVILDEKSTQ